MQLVAMCPEFIVWLWLCLSVHLAGGCAGNKLGSGTMASLSCITEGSARNTPVPNKGNQPWRAQPLESHRVASDSGWVSFPSQLWQCISLAGITCTWWLAQRSHPTDESSCGNNQVSSRGLSLLVFIVMEGTCWCQQPLPHEHAVKIHWIHVRERRGLLNCGVLLGTREERLFTVSPHGEQGLRGMQLLLLWLRNSICHRHSSNKTSG